MAISMKDTFGKMKKGLERFIFRDDNAQDDRANSGMNAQPEGYAPDPYGQNPYGQTQYNQPRQYSQQPYVPQNQFAQQQQYAQTAYTQEQYAPPRSASAAVNSSMQMPNANPVEPVQAEEEADPLAKMPRMDQQEIDLISVRSIQDCRIAISLLRAGAIVLLVMEGITDTGEMRRFVDTLSGACFSLNATISKVSHHGSYLLAPKHATVMMDPVINQMNMTPRARMRQQMQGAGYAGMQQPNPYQNSPYQPQQSPYGNAPYQQSPYVQQAQPVGQSAYDPRMSMTPAGEQMPPQQPYSMVERTGARPTAMPAFEQQLRRGYVPDTDE